MSIREELLQKLQVTSYKDDRIVQGLLLDIIQEKLQECIYEIKTCDNNLLQKMRHPHGQEELVEDLRKSFGVFHSLLNSFYDIRALFPREIK